MQSSTPRLPLLLLGIITTGFAAGCDESAVDPPVDEEPTLRGQVLAPADSRAMALYGPNDVDTDVHGPTAGDLTGEAPVPGVEVRVYDLDDFIADPEGAAPIATATTDSTGSYTAEDVSDALNALLLVDTEPRLASLVHGVDDDTEADISTTTTLAAEHRAAVLLNGGSVSEADFTEAVSAAESALQGASAETLSRVLNTLVPEAFGDGLPEDPVVPKALAVLAALGGADVAVCDGLALESGEGTPTTSIGIAGLTDRFGDRPWGWLYDAAAASPAEGDRRIAYLERTEADSGRVVVPVHPANAMGGGPGELVVMSADSTLACPGLELEVLALDPAPVTLNGLADSLEGALAARAETLGYDPADLRTTPARDLPSHITPIAAGLQAIDGPDFDSNLRNMLSGDAPYLSEPLTAENQEVAEAVMHEAGFTDAILTTFEGIGGLRETPAAPAAFSEGAARTAAATENDLTIETPEQLDFWMDAQSRCANTRTGAAGAARTAGGLVIAGAGAIAGGPAVATIGGIILFLQELILRTCDQNFPSELIDLQVTAGPPTEFNEDGTERGPWTAFLAAESEGFTLSWPDVVGNIPGLGDLVGVAGKAIGLNADILGYVHAVLSTAMGLDSESEAYSDPPRTWAVEVQPERAGESTYFDWELRTVWSQPERTEAFIFVDNDTRYLPTAAGEAELRVETMPQGSDVFNGQYEIGDATLLVNPIEVTIESPRGRTPFYVDPGEQLSFSATVENAHNDSVEWTAEDGSFTEITGAWNEQATYTAPDTDGRYQVRATSTASEGARSDREPERFDLVEVVIGADFVVSPDPTCIRPDETVEFSATFNGEPVPFSEISTSVSGPGTLTSDSVFEPSGTGTVTITFEYDPELTDEPLTATVTFEVQEDCTQIEVTSTRVDHATECVAYVEGGGVVVSTPSYPNADTVMQLSAETDISGEWTREIPSGDWTAAFIVYDSTTQGFQEWGYASMDDGSTMELQRELVEIDGVTTAVYSGSVTGSFEGSYPGIDHQEVIGATIEFLDVPEFMPEECGGTSG